VKKKKGKSGNPAKKKKPAKKKPAVKKETSDAERIASHIEAGEDAEVTESEE